MFAIRVPFAVLAGGLVSVALFLTLAQLVSAPFDLPPRTEGRVLEFTHQRPDTPLDNKRDPKVTREAPTPKPAGPRISVDDFGGVDITRVQVQRVDIVRPDKNIQMRGVDGDVVPIMRPPPDYPPRAITNGREGWVQLRFSVTAAGSVRDAVVVASEPDTLFDEAALKSIARWRYNPRVEGGVAVERVGLQTVIRFELEN